jgi:quinol monooxygenase YgiN
MVRVIIERHCRPDKDAELGKLLVELRSKGMHQPGYVSGETLRSSHDPSLWLVISTWLDAEQWETWENSQERRDIVSKIEPLLSEPEKVSIFDFVR